MKDIFAKRVLVVEDAAVTGSAAMRGAIDQLERELQSRDTEMLRAVSYAEATITIGGRMDLDAVLVASDMKLNRSEESAGVKLLNTLETLQPNVPVFLLADREETAEHLSEALLRRSSEFIWIFEDSPLFIAGRILCAIDRYRAGLLPPLMKAIVAYNEHYHEYSWAAPGHQGGRGFTKSPVGKKFYDFYDENLFRTDTGIERTGIGSLLDHTGAFADSERETAATFGADRSFNVVVGTSGSNRTVMQACLTPGDVAVCDRNCHKSIEQGLILTGAVPVYLQPARNRYGIIGPVPPREMESDAVKAKIAQHGALVTGDVRAYAVVTNCTYDGLCYNAAKVEKLLGGSVDRLHFDEAWYAYARFNRIYRDHHAMRGDPAGTAHSGPTLFATHSTHKLLAALSQASFIHVRHGRRPVGEVCLDQAYMMHATTSPLYSICASNDVAARMMADSGPALTTQVIEEAVDFRQALARLARDFRRRGTWFFDVWNPPVVTDPATGKTCDFADAPRKLLVHEQSCWQLRPGEEWHDFGDVAPGWAMIDPIKVSILAPGIRADGSTAPEGVPAALVAAVLYRQGIIPTRTTDFQLMFLFSIGITRGKWVTLLNALLRFKQLYDADAPIAAVLPELVRDHAGIYGSDGLRSLGDRMLGHLRENTPTAKLNAAFEQLPEMAMTPREAYLHLVRDNVELVPSDRLAGRIAANAVIPYPPGIPLMISGERFGAPASVQAEYLQTLERWDAAFPGFGHETEGAEVTGGKYHVMCVRES